MGRIATSTVVGIVALLLVQPSHAVAAFDAPRPLASNANTDSPSTVIVDIYPDVAGDGAENWVAIWSSTDAAVGVHPGALAQDAVFSRSADDGRTWSPVAILNSDALAHDARAASVATNGEGTWIAGLHGDTAKVEIVRSIDGGNTWSVPTPIDGLTTEARNLRIVSGADGKWIAAWLVYRPYPEWPWQLILSESTDDGVTWSAGSHLDDGWYADGFEARLATDHAGTWIAIWCTGGDHIQLSRSVDDGTSWNPRLEIGGSNQGYVPRPDLATDGSGTWIAVWNTTFGVTGADAGNFTDMDIVASRSTDNGATWSEAVAIGGVPALANEGQRESPRVRYNDGVWQVVWTQAFDKLDGTIGNEGDLVDVPPKSRPRLMPVLG
jgi:hypothetical protein